MKILTKEEEQEHYKYVGAHASTSNGLTLTATTVPRSRVVLWAVQLEPRRVHWAST